MLLQCMYADTFAGEAVGSSNLTKTWNPSGQSNKTAGGGARRLGNGAYPGEVFVFRWVNLVIKWFAMTVRQNG